MGRMHLSNNSSNNKCSFLYFLAVHVFKSARSKWLCGVSKPPTQANRVLSLWDHLFYKMCPTLSLITPLKLTRVQSLTNPISWIKVSKRALWTQHLMGLTRAPEWRNPKSRVIIIIVGATVELIKNKISCKVNNKIHAFSNSTNTKTW